ncbi:glycoside hydrolase superfamily [Clohesyomyces aquaticus]|uniref:Alpha-galactosidase n=1 Tax=Clohesyomyces aquaticus TaxID=1231657 RepID=A0A1Y2A0D3_9PLEO|nr:glycoside hydrolase superfamily [Clohesyomyces aquaticus]
MLVFTVYLGFTTSERPSTIKMSTMNAFAVWGLLVTGTLCKNARTSTPSMGWNSYNKYGCNPTETIIKNNAKGLVDQGLLELGYEYITIDCGWNTDSRDSKNRLFFNKLTFPSGGVGLGTHIHGLGLKYGLYSGAGVKQCGSETLKASLGFEKIDAETFAEWGGDSLKYDNCWPDSKTMVQYSYPEKDPSTRFRAMADALDTVSRPIVYEVCQWGVGENLGPWAGNISSSWRISNDIQNSWPSIFRITNQVLPFFKHTGVGKYADMDMLEVGNGGLTVEEEKTHFGLWAIFKSPLVIGASLIPKQTRAESMAILKNKEVIAINQDSLGQQAQLVRRFTEEAYDIFAGDLSGGRKVVAIVNWGTSTSNIAFDPSSVGISSASKVRDVYSATDLGALSAMTKYSIPSHGIKLLVVFDMTPAPAPKELSYYSATAASISGSAKKVNCGGDDCAPVHSKITGIAASSPVSFSNVDAKGAGQKLVGVDFINYDVALGSAWSGGTNTRDLLVSVNGGKAKKFSFPISGGDWYETGRMNIILDGFVSGTKNVVRFEGTGASPDLVGFAVLG